MVILWRVYEPTNFLEILGIYAFFCAQDIIDSIRFPKRYKTTKKLRMVVLTNVQNGEYWRLEMNLVSFSSHVMKFINYPVF